MPLSNLKTLCLILLLTLPGLHFPVIQAQQITVREIPALDKLPVNAIHRIFQDSEGYMWYGTFNGICRYDGYEVLTFRSDFNHPNLLKDNYITYINEDRDNKIWFGTYNGVYTLDKSTFKITPIDLGKHSDAWVFSIYMTRDGNLWVSVPGALFRLDAQGKILRQYDFQIENWKGGVYFVYENQQNELLASITSGGMYRLNRKNDTFDPYYPNPEYLSIERIIWDKKHQCYWLGTWGNGIVRFTPDETDPRKQYTPQSLPTDISGQPVSELFHMVQDDELNYLWVTTIKDLFAFRIKDDATLELVDTSPFLNRSNKMLYEIYKDKHSKMWVSAFDVKSFIVDIHDHFINNYPLTGLSNRIKANPAIIALLRDEAGVFWFTQERYGLCLYNPETQAIAHFSEFEETKNLPLRDVPFIIASKKKNRVWISNYSSRIYGLLRNNMKMQPDGFVDLLTISDEPGEISALYEDPKNRLWIGTTTGLFVYDILNHDLKQITGDFENVVAIKQSGDGKTWVLMNNQGICSLDANLHTETFPFEKDFTGADVTSDGNLWLGTGKGEVLLFNSRKKQLEDFSMRCGLNGDIINSITVDQFNHVWITTNQSIKEYNPANGAYRKYSTHNPNFLLSRILPGAVYFDPNDAIYFGGISGITSIPPSQRLEGIPENVTTHVTHIKIMDHSIWGATEQERMKDETLYLNPTDRNLEVEFSSLDFHNLDQVRYSYQLIGVDDDWVYPDEGSNSAFYNHLKKGSYTFKVRATDKNGLWSNHITQLTIVRLPYWYESWWAIGCYIILLAGGIWLIVRSYRKKVEDRSTEKWADSAELVKMHAYVNSKKSASTPEFVQVDQAMIDKATKIVNTHLDDPTFSVDRLAEGMNMSRSTLSRKIKAITGKTAFELIKNIKMEHARTMLENKTANITEVMNALGYSDHKNFSDSFKSSYGITPGEHQKKSNL